MARQFNSNRQYFEEVKDRTSDELGWTGLRLSLTRETSNDVLFSRTLTNTLTLELTGTSRHLTQMDGIAAERRTQPGDVCRIPAGVSARFAWDVSEPEQRSIVIEFGSDLFSAYCPERFTGHMAGGHLVAQDYAPSAGLATLMQLLARELDPQDARGPLFSDLLIRLLAIEICETGWSRKPRETAEGIAGDRRFIRAVDFINAHLARHLSLREIADASALTMSQLIQLFRQNTGSSPYAYVIAQRVARAKRLLETTDLPIARVAIDAGFADQAHLTRMLRRHLGATPRNIRLRRPG